jgi:hypothetical protein
VHVIDYDETFTPVAKMDSIGLEISIAEAKGWEVHHMDVKNAFLHSDLFENIYMEQPHGFMKDSYLVCQLNKSLYGLKQAPKALYSLKIDSYLLSQNFVCCKSDPNFYMLKMVDSLILLVMYVDDFLITSCSTSTIVAVKRILHEMLLMTDMGPLHLFLELETSQDASSIKMYQAKYEQVLLERFHMTDCKSTPTPFLLGVRIEDGEETPLVDITWYRQLVGILLYLTHSRLELSYAVGEISRFMQEPHELHWKAAKHILRYV